MQNAIASVSGYPTATQLLQQYPSLAEYHHELQLKQQTTGEVAYTDWATLYALSVLRGRTPACLHVQAACSRFILDIWKQANDPSFGYTLDEKIAYNYLSFMESLPFVQGKQGRKRELVTLMGFQIFIAVNLFGWVYHNSDGEPLRRFTRAYIQIPRKNGKTTLAVTMTLASLVLDPEEAPQAVFMANTQPQATLSFDIATLMIKRAKWLQSTYGLMLRAEEIRCGINNGTLKPLPSKPGDGGSTVFCVQDEYHEAPKATGYDAILNGMTARDQPLMVVITTAGEDISSPCYAQRNYASDTVYGKIQDDSYFSMIYELDDKDLDRWDDPIVWHMINPNLGVSIETKRFEELAKEAKVSPLKRRTFMVKRLNRWVRLGATVFDTEKWKTLRVERDISVLHSARMWCGSDLAFIEDFAVTGGFIELPASHNSPTKYRAVFQCWLPEQRFQTLSPTVREWGNQGWIKTTPGNLLDLDELVTYYRNLCQQFKVQIIQNDPNHASQLLVRLASLGVPVVPLAQTANNLSEPCKWLIGMINAGRIEHDGNPVIEWMLGNVVAREDAGERIYPMRADSNRKIDAAIAMIIAASGLIKQVSKESRLKTYWSEKDQTYKPEQPTVATPLERLVSSTRYLE